MVAKSNAGEVRPVAERVAGQLGRRHSAAVLGFHQAVADALGINATDLKALDMVNGSDADTVTAGQIAQATGITSGAATFLVDRLEKAGIFTRHRDPADRRRWVLRVTPEQQQRVQDLYEPLRRDMEELTTRYTDEQLTLIGDFIEQSDEILATHTRRLQQEPTA